jgi:iron complex transport system permease protein
MPELNKSKNRFFWLALSLGSLFILLAAPFFGLRLDYSTIFDFDAPGIDHSIFWRMRVPRVLMAYVAGASLSLCGMCFQALFQNALATPYTLGVSSAASLAVAIQIFTGCTLALPGFNPASSAAFLGAALSIILVYTLAGMRGNTTPALLLLAGVALSFFFSSLIMFFQYISNFTELQQLMRWLMGGLQTLGYVELLQLSLLASIGIAIVLWHIDGLNLLAIGDEFALSRGLNVARLRKLLFFAVSLIVGAVVAYCGPIGFVGMVCPHICRLICGSNLRRLAPASLLFGGAFLLCCDSLGRCIIAPVEIPTGIISALLGGPFFLWLLFAKRENI